ncbi:MAG TPA: ABC-type transport auxiliary lipoprotein family protein [Casimicrobiaceae bacterium]|nr:ABC-type transport auxiliary lipoprotein family protein [Casimicrobiaceae bacterium]
MNAVKTMTGCPRNADARRAQSGRTRRSPGIVMLALAVFVSACTALQPPPAEIVNVYVLDVAPALGKVQDQPRRDVVIAVAPPRAWPGFDTTQMVYVRSPYALEAFAVSRWTDAPARMLAPLLVRALEQTGSYRAVVQMPTTATSDLRLDAEAVRLQQNFATRPSRAEISIRLQLTDVRSKRVIASDVIEETENAASEDAAGGVLALNTALRRVLERVTAFCAQASASR